MTADSAGNGSFRLMRSSRSPARILRWFGVRGRPISRFLEFGGKKTESIVNRAIRPVKGARADRSRDFDVPPRGYRLVGGCESFAGALGLAMRPTEALLPRNRSMTTCHDHLCSARCWRCLARPKRFELRTF